MKTFPGLIACLFLGATLRAQNYEYQYPSDPYGTTAKPQSNYQGYSSSSGSSYGYDKLLTYGALEVRYNYNDFDDEDLGGSSGIGASLRAQIFKPLYVNLGVNWLSGSNDDDESFDLTTLNLGAGLYLPVASRFHLFGEVGLRWDIADGLLESANPDDFSVYLRPGLRFAATERWELAASVLFATTDNYNRNIFELNTYYALLSVLDVGLGVDFASDVNTYHAGLRLRW